MRTGYSKKNHFLLLAAFFAWLVAGCAGPEHLPDHREEFTPDSQKSVHEDTRGSEEPEDRFQPRITGAAYNEDSPSEQPMVLSIEDVILLALRNNRDLQVQQLNPVIAGAFERIERGKYDPEVFAEFGYAEETASETSRATSEQFDVEASDTTTMAGIRQDLPTGTSIAVTVEHERQLSNRAPDQEIARVGLSITQSLLQGFGQVVNLVRVRQAEMDTKASVYELRGFTEALVADTEIAYWHYVLALREISIFESSLAIAQQQRNEIEQQIEVGSLPEIEAAAARAEVARRDQALIDARSLMEERRLRLLRFVNKGDAGQMDLQIQAVSDPGIEPEPIRDQAQRIALGQKVRPDLCEARLRVNQGRLETIATRSGMLPKLDLFIDIGRTGFAESFSSSFRGLNDNTYDFTAGVSLSRFLGNRAAEARHEAAWASVRQAAEAVDNLSQIAALDVRLAVNEVERSRQQIFASQTTRRLEEETARAEQERFEVGAGTALLAAQAQRDLLASRIEEIRAVINYRIALVKLYLAEGSLLQRRGVTIGDSESTVCDDVNTEHKQKD